MGLASSEALLALERGCDRAEGGVTRGGSKIIHANPGVK